MDERGELVRCYSGDNSFIHKKIYWCFFEEGVLVSLHEKAGANLRIFKKMRIYLKELSERSSYLQNFWYSLKYCTGILHGIYRLYYKLLLIYGDSKIKSPYHNLVHGPHTIWFNARLLPHLIDIVLAQICDIYHMVSRKYYLKLQDKTSMVGVHTNKSLEKFLDFDDHFFGEFRFGKPVKLEWL